MLNFKITGFVQTENQIGALKDRFGFISPVLETRVKQILQEAFRRVFDAEGIPRWRKLSPYTLREKQRLGYGSKPILERTGRLRRSYVGESSDSTWSRTRNSIVFENSLRYASIHERGGERIPRRPVVASILQQKAVRKAIQRAILEETVRGQTRV